MNGEHISALNASREMLRSPVQFVRLLRENRERLPLAGASEAEREEFYTCPVELAAEKLEKISLHWLDLLNYQLARKNPIDPQMSADELRKELTETRSQVVHLERKITSLEAEIAQIQIDTDEKRCDGKGLVALVCRMRREKKDKEIAAHLYDNGKWCSKAQVGALLHNDDSRIHADSMQQRAKRLLNPASE